MADTVVVTNTGRQMIIDRLRTSATYTTEPKFVAMGTGSHTAAVADTALTTETDSRATGVSSIVTVNVTSDTYQVVGTTSAGAGRAIIEAGLFDVVTSSSGNMFVSATFSVINLNNGDSIQFTFKVTAS